MVRDVMLLGHKQAFCWIDEWFTLTMEDIRKYEAETKEILDKIRQGDKPPTPKPSPQTSPKVEEDPKSEQT